MRVLDASADGALVIREFKRVAVGIATLIDRGTRSVEHTGQHRILAAELIIGRIAGIYDCRRLYERYDLYSTGFRLCKAHLHAAGIVGGDAS